jgi:uncharacterized protein YciI
MLRFSPRDLVAAKFVLLYHPEPTAMAKAQQLFPAHRARLDDFHARGLLLHVGPFADRSRGAMGIFTSRQACDDFIREDPFMLNGVVARHEVLQWDDMFD